MRSSLILNLNQVITSHHSSSHLREQVSDIIEIKKAGSRAADVVVRLMLEEKTKAATLYVYEAINIGVGASVAIAVDKGRDHGGVNNDCASEFKLTHCVSQYILCCHPIGQLVITNGQYSWALTSTARVVL